jgi:hypothetical protein
MSRDPVFESLTDDGALIDDIAQKIPEIGLAPFAQSFLGGERVLTTPESMRRVGQRVHGG